MSGMDTATDVVSGRGGTSIDAAQYGHSTSAGVSSPESESQVCPREQVRTCGMRAFRKSVSWGCIMAAGARGNDEAPVIAARGVAIAIATPRAAESTRLPHDERQVVGVEDREFEFLPVERRCYKPVGSARAAPT